MKTFSIIFICHEIMNHELFPTFPVLTYSSLSEESIFSLLSSSCSFVLIVDDSKNKNKLHKTCITCLQDKKEIIKC